MSPDISVLVFSGLALTLVGAMALPAPAFKVNGETAILVALLVGASLATVLTGAIALLDMPAVSAVCGVIAWLLVVQCVWLARGAGQEEWDAEEEEDDGGGGSPGPSTPPVPPSPGDGLPVLQPSGGAPALPAWGPAPAHSFPLAAAPTTAQVAAAPCAAAHAEQPPPEAPETVHRRRLRRPPRRIRGDHRSIVHVRAAGAHRARRRRASLRLRLLRGCRRLLWPAPPECTPALPSFGAPEHDGRRRAPQRERLDREAGSRSAVL